jgi:hypothetical protein
MILDNQQKQSEVLTEGIINDTIAMSLDLDSTQMLMQMLSKNLYSDEVGSTIRELCANSLDSCRRAGVDKPIVVSLKPNDQYNYEFSVEDFGIGLDDDDVRNIISKYGKSLAREEANSLGLMGLGFKSPLAYTSAFYFICRKSGIERKYMMYEGEDGNAIDNLYEQPTDKEDGVKVIVPLKSGDKWSFINKIKEQLAYFENVFFDCDGYVDNNFLINRSEHFQHSELSTDTDMHLCLDNVYYPLDFNKLDIKRINVPVGLRFGLQDGIFPIPNREALRYVPETKKVILEKICRVADYFVDLYNEQVVETDDIKTIFEYYKTKERIVTLNDKSYNISTLIPFSTKHVTVPTYKGIKYLDLEALYNSKDCILNEYVEIFQYNRGKLRETNNNIRIDNINTIDYFLFTDKVNGNKREYVKSTLHTTTHFIKKRRSFVLGTKYSRGHDNYFMLLELDKRPKHLWRKIIQEFQQIQQIYVDMFKNYDAIEIPKSWLDERKKKKVGVASGRRIKLTGEIFGKQCEPLARYVSGKSSKLVPITLELESLHKYKGITVYSSYNNAELLDPLYNISRNSRLRMVAFSDRELKLVNTFNIHNLMSYDKFMEGKNMPFKRLVTAYLINELISEYSHVFAKRNHLKSISIGLYDKINILRDYKYHNYNNAGNTIFLAMLEVAKEHKLFDPLVYTTYLEIKELLGKLKFLNVILKQSVSSDSYNRGQLLTDEETHSLLVDLFKYQKHRINLDNYKIALKPIPVEENIMEEEGAKGDDEWEEQEDNEEEVPTEELIEEFV